MTGRLDGDAAPRPLSGAPSAPLHGRYADIVARRFPGRHGGRTGYAVRDPGFVAEPPAAHMGQAAES